MDRYHIALFLHVVTLIVAASATAITKLAVGRRMRARTIGEVLDWHNVLISASRFFPISLASFVITGMYMLSVNQTSVRSTGFVIAGLVGVTMLLVSGIFLGAKAKGLKTVLDGMAAKGLDQPAPKLVPPPLVAVLPVVNTGIALAVVFDMITKPSSVPVALGIIALGIVISAASAMRGRPAPVAEHARAA